MLATLFCKTRFSNSFSLGPFPGLNSVDPSEILENSFPSVRSLSSVKMGEPWGSPRCEPEIGSVYCRALLAFVGARP